MRSDTTGYFAFTGFIEAVRGQTRTGGKKVEWFALTPTGSRVGPYQTRTEAADELRRIRR